MRKIITITAALSAVFAATATATATPPRVLRSEFIAYDTREAALSGDRHSIQRFTVVNPTIVSQRRDAVIYMQGFDTDPAYGDYNTYLHLENVGSAYTLLVNGKVLAEVEDDRTPADFILNDVLVQGRNTLTLELRESRTPQINNGTPQTAVSQFEGSRLYSQRKVRIDDFSARILPDSTGSYGVLTLDIIAANDFNFEERFSVGYDITSPSGKLLDYTVREVTIPGHSRDTIHITAPIYDAPKNPWGEYKDSAPLYRVVLYIKRGGKPEQYIPFNTAYGSVIFADGKLTRNGRETEFIPHRYVSQPDRTSARREIERLKSAGVNTLMPDYPQPEWFYDECDKAGMYVLDRAAIYAEDMRTIRSRGGTPSNDPELLGEYISRIESMYFRMRNHPSVAGFLLGGEAGNGYNLYKAYQHLKSLETQRPVLYDDARGEWNSDM